MANRNGLTVIEGSTRYPFTIAKDETKQSRGLQIIPKPWEQGDPQQYWKEALHPWDGGLASDRLDGRTRKYSKANADLSNPGLLVPPPLINTITTGAFDITYVGTDAQIALAGTSLTLTYPTTIRPGDLVLLWGLVSDADAGTIGTGSGTIIGAQQDSGSMHAALYRHTYSGTALTNTITYSATADSIIGVMVVYRNVDNTTPINQSGINTDSTSPYDTASITPSSDNCMIVSFGGKIAAGVGSASGFTTRGASNNASGTVYSFDKLQTTAAAVTASIVFTGSDAAGATGIVALNKASFTFVSGIAPAVNFNSKSWTYSGTLLLSINSSYTLTIEAVLGTITDLVVFNNELIIGQGASTKIYKATAATPEVITQATDNTYAIKLVVVGKNLWRSTSNVAVSSCLTTPLTLANWGTDYTVGDTSWAINILIAYNGTLWVGKQNGFYAPDVNTNFWNQTPQLLQWPDTDNCKGSFVAKGYLWCPSLSGLLRITTGESLIRGPELSNRPAFRFHIHSGVEWSGAIYLLCHDHAAVEQTVIIKMVENTFDNSGEYVYHEWARLGSTTEAGAIGVSIYPTNPSLILGHGTAVKYIKLGRGGGREIDDALYGYGLSWEIETGFISPSKDMSLANGLIGIQIVTDQDSTETIDTIQYKIENGSYVNMLDNQESGGGAMPITDTSGYASVTRYADKTTNQGQFFSFKLAGSMSDAALGTDRPEIREAYAFGYSHLYYIDHIKIPIYAEANAITGLGMRSGDSAGYTAAQFKRWLRDQTTLTFELPDYEESRTTRGRVIAIEDEEVFIEKGTDGIDLEVKVIIVTLARDDFAGTLYNV